MVTQPGPEPAPHTFPFSQPRDIVAAIPCLLGYHPDDMLVVIGLSGASVRARLIFRGALTADAAGRTDLVARVADTLGAHGCDSVLAIAYGSATRATPCVDALRAALAAGGITLREALRVTDGRFWSYLCDSVECCPPDGAPVDPGRSPVAATAVLNGLTARRDLDQVRQSLAPIDGAVRDQVKHATRSAERRGEELRATRTSHERDPFGAEFRTEGVRVVRETVVAAFHGTLPDDPPRIAWLGVLLMCVRVRDEAWVRIGSGAESGVHVRLWRHILRHVEPGYVAAPGALLAVAAWHAGDRALAEASLDAVDRACPQYSMAQLVRQAVRAGLPPDGHAPTPEWLEQVCPVAGSPDDGGEG